MTESGKRDELIDVIKGIGIFLMVLRHARFPKSDVVLLFHMAVFFIASGYLYKPFTLKKHDIRHFICRKIKTLWVPYAVTNLLFVTMNNLLIKCNIYTLEDTSAHLGNIENFAVSKIYTWMDYIKCVVLSMGFQLNTNLGGGYVVLRHAFWCTDFICST